MEASDLIEQAKRIITSGRGRNSSGILAEASEFLRVYAGEKSSFLKTLNKVDQSYGENHTVNSVAAVLEGFIRYVENDLLEGISIERQAQVDVVSDFLEQASTLLSSKGVHPAALTVIIGAALEEFLRTWVEEEDISLQGRKPSLDSYAKSLRESELISKQDLKDITSWGGLRNHAAHGEWDEVDDKKRVSLMLEGVNLFMRKYGK